MTESAKRKIFSMVGRHPVLDIAPPAPVAEPVPALTEAKRKLILDLQKPSRFDALVRLPGYWTGRAAGRQAAIDFYRGIACQRETTLGVDVGHDALRDHRVIAEYEQQGAKCR